MRMVIVWKLGGLTFAGGCLLLIGIAVDWWWGISMGGFATGYCGVMTVWAWRRVCKRARWVAQNRAQVERWKAQEAEL